MPEPKKPAMTIDELMIWLAEEEKRKAEAKKTK